MCHKYENNEHYWYKYVSIILYFVSLWKEEVKYLMTWYFNMIYFTPFIYYLGSKPFKDSWSRIFQGLNGLLFKVKLVCFHENCISKSFLHQHAELWCIQFNNNMLEPYYFYHYLYMSIVILKYSVTYHIRVLDFLFSLKLCWC